MTSVLFNKIDFCTREIDFWRVSPVFIFLMVTIVTIGISTSIKELDAKNIDNEFDELVNAKIAIIKKRFTLYEQALLGGVGFIEGSNHVSRDEWLAYVNALKMNEYLPGSNGIGVIKKVNHSQIDDFIRSTRQDGYPDFEVHPKTLFDDKFIIQYIEPEEINKPAVGLDIGFETHRRQAAEASIRSGRIVLTKTILLVQDEKQLPGFLLLAPFYDTGMTQNSEKERMSSFIGWVYSPFMARKFLADIGGLSDEKIGFTIYQGLDSKYPVADESRPMEKQLIYQSPEMEFIDTKVPARKTTQVEFASQKWHIKWYPAPSFYSQPFLALHEWVFLLGILLAVLLSSFFYVLSKLYGASAQKSAEHQKQLTSIFNSTVDGIITIDEMDLIVGVNPACEQMFGYSLEELIGKHIKQLMPGLYNDHPYQYLSTYLQESGAHIIGETREALGMRRDGTEFTLELSVSETEISLKKYFTGIMRDISERKKMNQIKDDFVSTVSHELRTPLTSIQTSLNLLAVDLNSLLSAEHQLIFRLATENCERLAELVNDILDFEKIVAGKMKYEFEPFEMEALVRKIVAQNEGFFVKHQVSYQVESSVESVYCQVDQIRFAQALSNLLSNAAKFSYKGGVVKISLRQRNSEPLIIAVADKGSGIPEAFKKHVFKQFAQADSTSTRAKGGTGLGLNITQSIVQAFGGEISFESAEGVGTTFYMTLPVVDYEGILQEAS